jgi:hypothetical protein
MDTETQTRDALDALRPPPEREAEIRAAIAAYNAERPAQFRRHILLAWGGTAAFCALVLLTAWLVAQEDPRGKLWPAVLGVGAGLVFLVWRWLGGPMRAFQQDLRQRILPVAFAFVGDVRYCHGETSSRATERLKETELIGFTRAEIDNGLSGRHDDFAFEFVEAKLASGSGKHKQTHFAGLIFRFVRDRNFPGRIFASTRPNAVARFFRDMIGTRLAVLDRHDGSRHEYRTDNPAAARALIGERLDQAVDWLDRTWTEGPAQLVLAGQDGFVLLPTGRNWFELPGIGEDIVYERHVEPMIWDLVRLLAIARLVRQV